MFKNKKLKLYKRENINLFLKNILISNKFLQNLSKKNFNILKDFSFINTHYSDQLKEKRKLKIIYGISNKKYNIYYKKSKNKKNNNDIFKNLLLFLELRLDNFIYRCGFSTTRNESKQMINHKFIKVNNFICKHPSKILKVGDFVSLNLNKNFFRKKYFNFYFKNSYYPKWIFLNNLSFSSYLKRIPNLNELNNYVNIKNNLIFSNF